MRARRRQQQTHIYLERGELERVLDVAALPARGVPHSAERNTALIMVMALAGLRVSEVAQLNRGDLQGRWLWVWHGKTDKERRVPLNSQLLESLLAYLATRVDEDPAMFLSRNGQRVSTRAIRSLVVQTVRSAGVVKTRDGKPVNVSPHKLRHTAGTLLAQANVPTHKIMDILGHNSESTAHIYMAETAGLSDVDAIELGSPSDLLRRWLKE